MTEAEKNKIIDSAVNWAIGIAKDNSHGYSQYNRWGNPDYDCSSLVISAWQQAGVPLKTGGATYTGNMLGVMLKNGFVGVPITQRRKGDVLLNVNHHVAMMIDKDNIVHASIDENGTIVGKKGGDQTGKEICTRSYYVYSKGWDYCLRYSPKTNEDSPKTPTNNNTSNDIGGTLNVVTKEIKKGSKGAEVKSMQLLLNGKNNAGLIVDGDFGKNTDYALRVFQTKKGLLVDGICGENSWSALIKA